MQTKLEANVVSKNSLPVVKRRRRGQDAVIPFAVSDELGLEGVSPEMTERVKDIPPHELEIVRKLILKVKQAIRERRAALSNADASAFEIRSSNLA